MQAIYLLLCVGFGFEVNKASLRSDKADFSSSEVVNSFNKLWAFESKKASIK